VRRWYTVIVFGVVAACGRQPDPAAIRAELSRVDSLFAQETARDRAAGWARHFAPNGVMVHPGGTIEGRTAILDAMTRAFADTSFVLTWAPTAASASPDGRLGYTVGRYESRQRSAGGTLERETGTYVTIWRRQEDGTWQVVLDIGNPDPTPRTES